jgi:hypothetical protein
VAFLKNENGFRFIKTVENIKWILKSAIQNLIRDDIVIFPADLNFRRSPFWNRHKPEVPHFPEVYQTFLCDLTLIQVKNNSHLL